MGCHCDWSCCVGGLGGGWLLGVAACRVAFSADIVCWGW